MNKILLLNFLLFQGSSMNIETNKINFYDKTYGPVIRQTVLNRKQPKKSYTKGFLEKPFVYYGLQGDYKNFNDFCHNADPEPEFQDSNYKVSASIGDNKKWHEENNWLNGYGIWPYSPIPYEYIQNYINNKFEIINIGWTSNNAKRNTFIKVYEWFSDNTKEKELDIHWEYEMENNNEVEPVKLLIQI